MVTNSETEPIFETTVSTSPSDCPIYTLNPCTEVIGYDTDYRGCPYPITQCRDGCAHSNYGYCERKNVIHQYKIN